MHIAQKFESLLEMYRHPDASGVARRSMRDQRPQVVS